MKMIRTTLCVLAGLLLAPVGAQAHCDAVEGPVATAALQALEQKNVNLVQPYVPAESEAELAAAFEQAVVVRAKGVEAKALADRYFMETAVRLHRAGEKATYTGLKPAGTDFGPAIPAAEKALESGTLEALLKFLSQEVGHGVAARFEHALSRKAATKQPATRAEVQPARERVSAELEFIGYVERIYLATKGGGHAE